MALDADKMMTEMERALEGLWPQVMGEDLPQAGREHLRLFLKAIACGVVKHLLNDAVIVLNHIKHDHVISCNVDIKEEELNAWGASLTHDHQAEWELTIGQHSHPNTGKIK